MPLDANFHEDLARFLPAPLIERLPEVNAITDALQHLNSLYKALTSFLPLYIAEDEISRAQDYRALRPGTFMFADVSGFTALSEGLAEANSTDGAEILTIIMNDYFAEMLEILAKSDGQLLKFAGDALLVFFPANDDSLADLHKAIRSGWRMQRAIKRFQPISDPRLVALLGGEHNFQLTMSIGVARGSLFEALVGNNTQRDHLIQGELPGMAMDAEASGKRDEVIIDVSLVPVIKDDYELTQLASNFFRVIDNQGNRLDDYEFEAPRRRRPKAGAIFDLSANSLLGHLRLQLDRVHSVAVYVAPSVLHELVLSSNYHLRSENRYSTTLFIYATGFAEMLRDWGEAHLDQVVALMERYYSMVQRVVTSRGGTLTRTDPYSLGIKLLGTFGAPVAHTDDPERAVDAALEITNQLAQYNQRLLEELPLELHRTPFVTQRIGVTLGIIFAGEVGWKARREYTVMGDEVNLAARLMTKAQPGQILISERVYERVKDAFEVEKIEPLHLKGKSLPVQAYSVKNEAAPTINVNFSSQMPFIGHDVFLLSLMYALNQAKNGRRRSVALVGDAGVGKTRIAQQIAKSAEAGGFRVAWATCTSRNVRKTTWLTLIAQLLQVDPAKNTAEANKLLRGELRELDLLDLEPMLHDLIFGSRQDEVIDATAPPENQNVFKVASSSITDEPASGLTGAARRSLEDKEKSRVTKTGLWRKATQRIALGEGLIRFLRTYTETYPVLLVVDDLHLENAQALLLTKQIVDELKQAKLVIIFTHEPTITLDFEVQSMVVPDLNEDETYQVALAILHCSELGPKLKQLLWDRSSGRPLFIEALLRKLLQEGYIAQSQGYAELKPDADMETLPDDVRELVISRVDSLTPEVQNVLRAAAVAGEDFTPAVLQSLSDVTDMTNLHSTMAELCQEQVLEKCGDDLYRFRHGLTQRAIYESLSRAQRLRLHQMAVKFWRTHREISDQPIVLAYHLMKSGLLPEAIEVVSIAAEDAEESGDIDRAVELYTHALTIFPDEHSIAAQLQRLEQSDSSEE